MNVNIELLDKALAYIDEHPEEWDQSTWDCGTAACIAGHMARLSGESLYIPSLRRAISLRTILIPSGESPRLDAMRQAITLRVTGLSDSHPMFDEGNTRATLQVWRDALAGERIEAPGADLTYALFEHVDMQGANLRGANLHNAVLTDVDLTGADLRDADLEDATLDRVNFTGADLRGAYLADSELRDVDFTGAKRGPQ